MIFFVFFYSNINNNNNNKITKTCSLVAVENWSRVEEREGPPRIFTMAAALTLREESPRGREVMALKCCSNWSTTQAFFV